MRFPFFTLLASALFASSTIASDNGRFLQKGLEVLYQQEVSRYRACRREGNSFCRFSELNFFLGLLDSAGAIHIAEPKYPRVAERSGWQGIVDAVLVISNDGTVSGVEILYCESGRTRDIKLRWRWELEGPFCKEFRYAAEKAFSEYKFLKSPESLKDAERLANIAMVYKLIDRTGRSDYDENLQLLDLNKGQARTLQKFFDTEDWDGLREYALERRDESDVFEYYLGNAAWESDNETAAIRHFSAFLREGGDRYWHFGTKAMVIAIDHFYEVGDDRQVVDVGNGLLLEQYLNTGNSVPKSLVAEALTKYAISLTLIDDQELAQSLYLLRAMENVGLYRGIPKELKEVIKTQRTHLESQIIALGRSKGE